MLLLSSLNPLGFAGVASHDRISFKHLIDIQKSIPLLKGVKMSIPPVSLRGKDFIISKIHSRMVNGAVERPLPNKTGTSLGNNMDSFVSSLAGGVKQRKV